MMMIPEAVVVVDPVDTTLVLVAIHTLNGTECWLHVQERSSGVIM